MTSDLTIVLSPEDAFGFRYDRNHCVETRDQLLDSLGLLPEDVSGLTFETLLLSVVTPSTLGELELL